MTLRKKIFIFTGLIAGILIAIILFIVLSKDKAEPTPNVPSIISGEQNNSSPLTPGGGEPFKDKATGLLYNTPVNLVVDGLPQQDITEQYLRQLASIFVERFNSYSNQGDNKHIEDALDMSTEKMARWINSQRISQAQTYSAVVTEVFSTEIQKLYDIRAVVRVQAKITKINIGSKQVEYKTGLVELLEIEENVWLVDKFVWEE